MKPRVVGPRRRLRGPRVQLGGRSPTGDVRGNLSISDILISFGGFLGFRGFQANSEIKIIEINADRTQMGNVGGGESFYFRDIFSFAEIKFTNFYANSIFETMNHCSQF